MTSSQAKHKLEVTISGDRDIVMTRVFHAPQRLVFDAFTKPELIKKWLLGPDGWSMPVCEVDLRPGGAFHYVWRSDSDETEFGINGEYRDVAQPERIVHVERFDAAMYPGDAAITTTFVERNGVTTVTMTQLYDTREIRDMAIQSGMETGVAKSFDRLDGILG